MTKQIDLDDLRAGLAWLEAHEPRTLDAKGEGE